MLKDDIHVGQIIKTIFKNHQQNKPTSKSNIKSAFKIDEINLVLERVDLQLKKYGMKLIGLEKEFITGYKETDKLFIINNFKFNEKSDEFMKKLIVVLTVIYLENEKITYSDLIDILQYCINDAFFNTIKTMGYVNLKKIDETTYVIFGWRYYAEFEEFNPNKIFKYLKTTEKEEDSTEVDI